MIKAIASRLCKRIRTLHGDQRGADMVEYILIVAAVALPLLAVILWFRDDLTDWIKDLWQDVREDADFERP